MKINNYDDDKIKKIFDQKLQDDFTKLSKQLNLIFKNSDDIIKKKIEDDLKIKTRNRKLSFYDALCYYFNYSFNHNTKNNIVSDYNFDNDIDVHMSNYQKKEAKIPLSFYQLIFDDVKKLHDQYIDNKKRTIAVDGTYNITNVKNDGSLETSLNLGIYDITNRIPIDIQLKGEENKNKEIESFIQYIDKNNIDKDNIIFVFDRAYFSYDFINYLDKKNINYVIRTKNNSLYLDKNKNNKKTNVKKLNDSNIRFITYDEKCIISKKDKNNNDVKLEKTIECNIVTNLSLKNNNDTDIKKIYSSRWCIEVFFKLIKSNFKFSYLKEHTSKTLIQYKKSYLIIMIEIYIIRLIELIYNKNNDELNNHKFNKKNKNKYIVKNNDSLMINGIKKIINPIIKSNINGNLLFNYSINYIKKINVQIGIYNERKCKNPHCKWYIKSYAEYYKYIKIIDALLNDKVDSLNKNLKLLASEIKIIK